MVKKAASSGEVKKKTIKAQPVKKMISPSLTKKKTKTPQKVVKNAVLSSPRLLTAEGWRRKKLIERKQQKKK